MNLVTGTENKSPDYYFTMLSQLYAYSNEGQKGRGDRMTEYDVFG